MVEIGGKAKKNPSTFFPKSWSPEKIIDAIENVYANPDSIDALRNACTGTVDGVEIQLFFDKYGKIVSAFPIIK